MSRSTSRRQNRRFTTDGFDNFAARLGLGQDNLLAHSGYRGEASITHNPVELENMYRTSWVVGRMVDVVAEDMVRGGITIKAQMEPGRIDELQAAMLGTGVPGRISDAIKWARLYGGALAVLLIDGHNLDEPLDIDNIGAGGFKGLYILDRYQVTPIEEKITDLGPMLGYPAGYRVDVDALSGKTIHHSRCLRFIGIELPMRQRMTEQYWGASVVERTLDRILALDSSTYGAANMMLKSHLRTIGIEGFRDILAEGGQKEAALLKMMAMIRQMQSNEGLTVLDARDSFTAHNWTFAGVYEALQAFAEQIAGATGIPLVRLLGQSPKGFSTGDSDLKMYYETILTAQDDDLRAPYTLILSVLARSLWGHSLPDGVTIEFNSLASLSELEKSQIATADAQSVAGLEGGGIITRAQALAGLRESARITGRWGYITDKDIAAAEAAEVAPPPNLSPTMTPNPVAPGNPL